MKNKILKFIHILKDFDIRISTNEIIDCYNCINFISIDNIVELYFLLSTTLIKNKDDMYIFNEAFNLYFLKPSNEKIKMDDSCFDKLFKQLENETNDINFKNLLDNIKKDTYKFDAVPTYDKFNLYEDIYQKGSVENMYDIVDEIVEKLDVDNINIKNIDGICEDLLYKNNLEYIKTNSKKNVNFKSKIELDKKYELIKEYLKKELEKKIVSEHGEEVIKDILKLDNKLINEKDIKELTIEDLENIIKSMKRKIKTYKTRKFKKSKRGKIDIKNTIKYSIKYNNVCSEIKYKNKKNTKCKLIVLCDISGSVQEYVCFMLQFIILIQNNFSNIKNYVFIDKIKEVTDEINNNKSLNETMNVLNNISDLGYGTNYGEVFREFDSLDVFDKKTIVIILGDAQNTGTTSGEEFIKNISNKCKEIIWLNPLKEEFWYYNSDLKKYEKYCKIINSCNTVKDLEYFIKYISKI